MLLRLWCLFLLFYLFRLPHIIWGIDLSVLQAWNCLLILMPTARVLRAVLLHPCIARKAHMQAHRQITNIPSTNPKIKVLFDRKLTLRQASLHETNVHTRRHINPTRLEVASLRAVIIYLYLKIEIKKRAPINLARVEAAKNAKLIKIHCSEFNLRSSDAEKCITAAEKRAKQFLW